MLGAVSVEISKSPSKRVAPGWCPLRVHFSITEGEGGGGVSGARRPPVDGGGGGRFITAAGRGLEREEIVQISCR